MTPTREQCENFVRLIEGGMKPTRAAVHLGHHVRVFAIVCQRKHTDIWARWKAAKPDLDKRLGETLAAVVVSQNPRLRRGMSARAIARVCGCCHHVITKEEKSALSKIRRGLGAMLI